MINTFYDKNGEAICYVDEDGYSVYLYGGKPVAWIDETSSIYAYSGKHLGWFINGWAIDHNGDSVFFTEDSTGGPGRPGRQGRPGRGGRQGRPGMPGRTNSWASYDSIDFFKD